MQPRYVKSHKEGSLKDKIGVLKKLLSSCALCPRKCGVDRLNGERGFCGAGREARVSSAFAHFGEESCLTGERGSGTIFFSYCNLKCAFCQNYELSHLAEGKEVSAEALSGLMTELKMQGCHNLNLVTPTHFAPQILEALDIAVGDGLDLPLIYNCGGYESEQVIDILDQVVDIYMPDAKFSSPQVSRDYAQAPDYFDNLKRVLKKMYLQVGDLKIEGTLAVRGLLLRHLVMPEGAAGTREVMRFVAEEISLNTYVNIMDQYFPCAQAHKFERINRRISPEEFTEAKSIALSYGLRRLD